MIAPGSTETGSCQLLKVTIVNDTWRLVGLGCHLIVHENISFLKVSGPRITERPTTSTESRAMAEQVKAEKGTNERDSGRYAWRSRHHLEPTTR
jgi:hypothetical protein